MPKLPLVMGDAADPILNGEVRGRWTTRDAHVLAALFDSISYGLQAEFNAQPVPPPPAGDTVPALPPLLDSMRQHLLAQDALLVSQPADPTIPRGGWLDRNNNGKPDAARRAARSTSSRQAPTQRLFDYSTAEFVMGESLPLGMLTPTASLPTATMQVPAVSHRRRRDGIERHRHRRAHLLPGRHQDRVPAPGERKDADPHREPRRHGPRVPHLRSGREQRRRAVAARSPATR